MNDVFDVRLSSSVGTRMYVLVSYQRYINVYHKKGPEKHP